MTTLIATAVIGANYGDEGKGATVHSAAHTLIQTPDIKPLVVRFNGGGQAGHTVQLADGRRRIFSQLGSGSYLGCPTYLSEHFLLNPVTFVREMRDWIEKEVKFPQTPPRIYAHPKTKIVTPWDVMMNQIRELDRADVEAQHGSCGQGIGATMERFECDPRLGLDLVYEDLFDLQRLITKVMSIKDRFYNRFASSTPASTMSSHVQEFLACIKLLPKWIEQADYLQLPKSDVIFEGAQGLLLDQDNKDHFPHVTYSKTGVTNVIAVLREMRAAHWDISLENVIYCTRPYLTRHGAGPMLAALNQKECSLGELELTNFTDATNVHNPWQGSLRFGKMDWAKFEERIYADFTLIPEDLKSGHKVFSEWPQVSMICADQDPWGLNAFGEFKFEKPIPTLTIDGRKGKL